MREIEIVIPNYAPGHQQYANNTLSALGRVDEAIVEGKRAVELDPLSLVINADLGMNYYYARRYDEAITQLRKTLEMDPGYYYAHVDLGQVLAAKRAFGEAISEYQKARALNDDPFVLGLLGHAYASTGNKTEALKILDQLKEYAGSAMSPCIALPLFISHSATNKRRFAGSNKAIKIAPALTLGRFELTTRFSIHCTAIQASKRSPRKLFQRANSRE